MDELEVGKLYSLKDGDQIMVVENWDQTVGEYSVVNLSRAEIIGVVDDLNIEEIEEEIGEDIAFPQ